MTDDRYTVDNPPRAGTWVCVPTASYSLVYWVNSEEQQEALANRAVYRTSRSALAHAHRTMMGDDILEALEMLVRAQDSESPTWREYVTRGARAVAKKARGEVEG